MKISSLFGKKNESEDKKRCGVIMAISCNKNVIEGYICFDENEKEFFASAYNCKFLKDKVIFKWLSREEKGATRLRLGVPAFLLNGRYLGKVCDYSVVKNTLCAVFIDNKRYPTESLSISDAVIVKPSAAKIQAEIAAKDMFIGVLCGD